MIIRVNYEKCTVIFRNQRIVKVAEDDIGEITAEVYGQALRLTEEKTHHCQPDPFIDEFDDGNDVTVSTMEVSQVLSPSINVAGGIGKASSGDIDLKSLNRTVGKRKREDEAEVEGEASADESEDEIMDNGIPSPEASGGRLSRATKVTFQDQPLSAEDRQGRMGQVKNHLSLLGAHSHHLLTKAGSRGLGEWQIEFNKIVEYMKEVELDNYICQTFGRQGLRVSRILREHGKLDEKQIQKIGLMKQKEIRTKLVELQMAGYADVQEVPKDNNRTPNRTIFLWWFDVERVMVLHLDRVYKAIANCIRRLEVERFEAADMLELTRRTDVMGHEDEMLTMEQLTRLGGFREKEDRLINEVSRLDELVGIFKEF
jgi:DNA-directed RNA polymerase III subunit RPC3